MTFTTLQAAIDSIQTAVGLVPGVRYKPDDPPDNVADFPFVVTYAATFTVAEKPQGLLTYLYDIRVELHVKHSDTPNDIAEALPYAESVPNAIFGAIGDTAQGAIIGTFGVLGWGGGEASIPTIGFSWTIQAVKIQLTLTP